MNSIPRNFNLFLLVLLGHTCFGQDYAIAPNGTWVQKDLAEVSVWDPISNTYVTTYETAFFYYTVAGDTILNGTSYRVIEGTQVEYDFTTGEITALMEPDVAWLFRNTSDHKAYAYSLFNQTESLWYDFGLEIGGMQTFSNIFNTNDFYLTQMDTVEWCDSSFTRHHYAYNPGGNPVLNIVKGIGALDNFLYFYQADTGMDEVLFFCPYHLDISDIELPILATSVEPDRELSESKLYPNPTNGSVEIDLGFFQESVSVLVKNELGQEILEAEFGSSQKLDFTIPGDRGVYVVELTSEGRREVFRVLKN